MRNPEPIIHPGAIIYDGVIIGDYCKIQAGAILVPGVVLQDKVFIGPGVIFTNVKYPSCFIRAEEFLTTKVHYGAVIGAGSVILPGITIGAYATVGAGAVVTKDVGWGKIVAGNPAKEIGMGGHRLMGGRERGRQGAK